MCPSVRAALTLRVPLNRCNTDIWLTLLETFIVSKGNDYAKETTKLDTIWGYGDLIVNARKILFVEHSIINSPSY